MSLLLKNGTYIHPKLLNSPLLTFWLKKVRNAESNS
jgi:hypothetical protein